jgi:4'-phosphopantetheinyl transferase
METIGAGEVHLWTIPLTRDSEAIDRAAAVLSPEERTRRGRFRFAIHRDRFALRRGAMRRILSRYCGLDPAELGFTVSAHGKPELDEALHGVTGIRFNLSDSADLAILGVTRAGRIGVDVERLDPMREMDAIARRHFSDREYEDYLSAPHERRVTCFYNAWTRKEAWLKACGDGLSAGLSSFDVTLLPGVPPRLVEVRGRPGEAARWTMHAWSPAAGYVAAVIVEDVNARFVMHASDGEWE